VTWLEDGAGGEVARVITGQNNPRAELVEFFNGNVAQVFTPDYGSVGRPPRGPTCEFSLAPGGALSFATGCGAPLGRILLDDEYGKLTLAGQRLVTEAPEIGRVVAVPDPAGAQAKALVYVPCGPPVSGVDLSGRGEIAARQRICPNREVTALLYPERAARFVMTWRGGAEDQQLITGEQVYQLPAGKVTRVSIPVPAGESVVKIPLPWSSAPPDAPDLIGAELVEGDRTTDLLY
jgi:hypothetical protein